MEKRSHTVREQGNIGIVTVSRKCRCCQSFLGQNADTDKTDVIFTHNMYQLIDGKKISQEIKDELKDKVTALKAQGKSICLAVIPDRFKSWIMPSGVHDTYPLLPTHSAPTFFSLKPSTSFSGAMVWIT